MTTPQKEQALDILKTILHLFHEKKFDAVPSVVCESEIEDLPQFLSDYVQGSLELNDFDAIDIYGVPCSLKPVYADSYPQLHFYEYDDGSGFELEYEMTSNTELVDLALQLKFLYMEDGSLKSIFQNVNPQ